MTISDLELLDLSYNKIEVLYRMLLLECSGCATARSVLMLAALQVVPKGLFPNVLKLRHINFSNNAIRTLPEDLGELK